MISPKSIHLRLTQLCLIFSAVSYLTLTPGICAEAKPTISRDSNEIGTPKKKARPKALILSHRGHWTVLPQGAVVHMPASLQQRVSPAPKGTYMHFKDFARKNASWVHTYPVNLDTARGFKKVEKYRFAALSRINKIVVTTHKRDPISLNKNAYPLTDENKLTYTK